MVHTMAALVDTAALDNGIVFGAVYGIVGLGVVLIFRANRVLNFALADIGMIGSFVWFELWLQSGWNFLVAAALAILTSGVLSLLLRLWLAPVENRRLIMVLGTLGASSILIWLGVENYGTDPYFLPTPLKDWKLSFWDLSFEGPQIVVLLASVVLAVGGFLVFRFTRAGLTFRAAAIDPLATELMGVNVGKLRSVTWMVAGMLSGLAAILVAPLSNYGVFFMAAYLVRALTAGLLGGMVSIPGTIIAGMALGIVEAQLKSQSLTPGLPELVLVGFVIIFLLLRAGKGLTRGATMNDEPLILSKQG